jgi:hypothetical protein
VISRKPKTNYKRTSVKEVLLFWKSSVPGVLNVAADIFFLNDYKSVSLGGKSTFLPDLLISFHTMQWHKCHLSAGNNNSQRLASPTSEEEYTNCS